MPPARSAPTSWQNRIICPFPCRWSRCGRSIPSAPGNPPGPSFPPSSPRPLQGDTISLGHLDPRRDLTFVKDTVTGFVKAATAPEAIGQVINLGTGRTVSIGELAHTIIPVMGQPKTIMTHSAERTRPPASEVWHLECDNRKAQDPSWAGSPKPPWKTAWPKPSTTSPLIYLFTNPVSIISKQPRLLKNGFIVIRNAMKDLNLMKIMVSSLHSDKNC